MAKIKASLKDNGYVGEFVTTSHRVAAYLIKRLFIQAISCNHLACE